MVFYPRRFSGGKTKNKYECRKKYCSHILKSDKRQALLLPFSYLGSLFLSKTDRKWDWRIRSFTAERNNTVMLYCPPFNKLTAWYIFKENIYCFNIIWSCSYAFDSIYSLMRSTSISSIFLSSELHLTQGLVTLVPEVTPYYKAQSESGWQIWAFDGVFDLRQVTRNTS